MAPENHELFGPAHPLSRGADVTLVSSDGRRFYCHSVMLQLWSGLFQELLAFVDEMQHTWELPVTDVASDVLLLLGCMYPHPARVEITMANCEKIFHLGDKYEAQDMMLRAARYLADTAIPTIMEKNSRDTTIPRVLECLRIAKKYSYPWLGTACLQLLGRKFFDWGLRGDLPKLLEVLDSSQLMQVMQSIPQPTEGDAERRPSSGGQGGAAHPGLGAVRRTIPVLAGPLQPAAPQPALAAPVALAAGVPPVPGPAAAAPPLMYAGPLAPAPVPMGPIPFMPAPAQYLLGGGAPPLLGV